MARYVLNIAKMSQEELLTLTNRAIMIQSVIPESTGSGT